MWTTTCTSSGRPSSDVDRLDRRSDLLVVGAREIGLVDLDVLAPRFGQALEILVQQLAEIGDHPRQVIVVFVVRDRRQQVRPRHGDLDRLARERRDGLELVDQPQVDRIVWRAADRGRVKHVGIVLLMLIGPIAPGRQGSSARNNSASRWAASAGCGSAVHLAAGDHIDSRGLLFQDRCLRRPELRIRKIAFGELTQGHEAVRGLVPARHDYAPTTVVV